MLYTLIGDFENFRECHFDQDQVWRIIEAYGDEHIDNRIDVNGAPRSFTDIVKEPLSLSFPAIEKSDKKKQIPDIATHSGRLLLNMKAYEALKPLIEQDGEFLPATHDDGEGYFFIPLRVAEDVEAINTELSKENQWNYFDHLVFHEERVKDWSLFRMRHDGYKSLFCQQSLKEAIENAQLTGLYITNDLANVFPEDRDDVTNLDS